MATFFQHAGIQEPERLLFKHFCSFLNPEFSPAWPAPGFVGDGIPEGPLLEDRRG